MSYAVIQDLLVNHLKTLSGLPALQEENTSNIGQAGQSFARATMIQSRPSQLTVGTAGKNVLNGLLQIDLFVPQDSGVRTVNTLADDVIEHFPRGLMLMQGTVNVHVVLAYRETGSRIDPFYNAPVVVQWSSIL